ncbi:MAG: hypothetical protein AAGD13_24260 [Pseudomonadota bacterium]
MFMKRPMFDPTAALRWVSRAMLAGSVMLGSEQVAFADDHAAGDDDFEMSATLYGWGVSFSGDTAIAGNTAEVDVGFGTLLENFTGGGMADVRLQYKNFGFFLNGVLGRATATIDGTVGRFAAQANLDMRLSFIDFGASYRFDPIPLGFDDGTGAVPSVSFEPYVGGRYTNIDVNVKFAGRFLAINSTTRFEFTDPIVGLKTNWKIAGRWRGVAMADIGGFGVGSDLSWNFIGAVGYDFSAFGERDATAFFGYRALGQDFSEGSGSTLLAWDVVAHGPIIGSAFRF